jgi:TonB family protein
VPAALDREAAAVSVQDQALASARDRAAAMAAACTTSGVAFQARMAKYQGVVVVQAIIDAQGLPRDLKVIQPLGMGLDEKALEAVRQYRFKPATLNGHPVAVHENIEVDFHIY